MRHDPVIHREFKGEALLLELILALAFAALVAWASPDLTAWIAGGACVS